MESENWLTFFSFVVVWQDPSVRQEDARVPKRSPRVVPSGSWCLTIVDSSTR